MTKPIVATLIVISEAIKGARTIGIVEVKIGESSNYVGTGPISICPIT